MPTDRPDDTPPRMARRATRRDEDTDEFTPVGRRESGVPTAYWLAAGGVSLVAVLVLAVVGVSFARGWQAAGRERAAAAKREADARWEEAVRQTREEEEPKVPAEVSKPTPLKSQPTVRQLDKAASNELDRAFGDNPVGAKARYSRVRFRMQIGVVDYLSTHKVRVEYGVVTFRSEAETAKLTSSRPNLIEFTVTAHATNVYDGCEYSDAIVITE